MTDETIPDVDWPDRNTAVLGLLGLDESLALNFRGYLVVRDASSDEYNDLRKLHDPAFDVFPSLIAVCTSADDVRIAISIAKATGLSAVCRSGGHSTAGYSGRDDALVIDLREMQNFEVNRRGDRIRLGAGLAFAQVNTVLGAFNAHIPGGACNSVCVGGYMQGGGYGFTSRIFGMNIDSVRSFRMMLADGRIAVASRDQNYDLFWAVRGGTGNNFGVLLDVDYTVHPLEDLKGFGLIWDLDDPGLPSALLTLQTDYMLGQPGSFGYMLAFRKLAGRTSLLMRGVYHGPAAEAQAWLDRLLAATGGRLEFKYLETYKRLETIMMEQYQIDPDGVAGAKEDKQSGYIDRMLTLAEWEGIVATIKSAGPILNFVVIEPYGGRIAEIPASDSAFVHRSVHMNFYVDVWWLKDAEKAAAVAWLDGFMAFMAPCFNGMTYQNYPRATFKDYPLNYWGIDAYTELVAIKKKYDPGDFFTFPQAIGRWPGFQPSQGIGCPKLTAAIQASDIVVEASSRAGSH